MATMISSGNDVVTFLKSQHQQIRELFSQVSAATGEERERAFYALRRLLAVHETAEEEIVHPAARRALPDGDAVVDMRLQEEHEAKQVLAQLENLDVQSLEFDTKLRLLEASVIAHAEAEERLEFERLAAVFDPDRLTKMRKAAEFAEAVAPTRPHPGVESATANMLVGPFASMIDRTRDAFSGKS
ncbi:MAG TPA: hemerythrin domain-containing protein [Polyangiaceae bacterium]|nr:hemerythrin domain-containing protein [Polyangiaceae bacterium]